MDNCSVDDCLGRAEIGPVDQQRVAADRHCLCERSMFARAAL